MKINRILAIVAALLFIASTLTYRESVLRAERFERGQKFLPNLNPDEIAQISITKGEETTQLERRGKEFVVVGAHGYPAKNESVNRFIRDVLELALEKQVGSGESFIEELELTAGGENTTEVAFTDASDKEMVRFVIGKSAEGGSGSYVLRADDEAGTIYLTSSRVYLSTGDDDFVKKDILSVEQSEVAAIRGADFAIEDQEGSLALAGLPAGKKESSKVGQVKSVLQGLRFSKHYLADDPEVRGLRFTSVVEVDLKDQSGYQLAVAQQGDKHYLRIEGYHSAGPLSVSLDADEDEVRETSELAMRQKEIQDFNAFHGTWIYEVTEYTAERIAVTAADLVEDA